MVAVYHYPAHGGLLAVESGPVETQMMLDHYQQTKNLLVVTQKTLGFFLIKRGRPFFFRGRQPWSTKVIDPATGAGGLSANPRPVPPIAAAATTARANGYLPGGSRWARAALPGRYRRLPFHIGARSTRPGSTRSSSSMRWGTGHFSLEDRGLTRARRFHRRILANRAWASWG